MEAAWVGSRGRTGDWGDPEGTMRSREVVKDTGRRSTRRTVFGVVGRKVR